MEKTRAPSEHKAQALRAVLQGELDGQSGEELLSTIVRLSTERILQEAWEQEQAAALGRGRYEARGEKLGYRNGDEKGTLKTAEGIFHVQLPQIRGRQEPLRSAVWGQMAPTSDVLKRLIVEMSVGGMSQREIEYRWESALGHVVLGKSTVSELRATLSDEYEAWRPRDLSQETVPYLFIDTVYEPLRRGGRRPASCVSGRSVRMGAKS